MVTVESDGLSTTSQNRTLVNRLIRTTLIATTATTALLLTAACSGSDDSSDEEIEGIDEGGNEQEQEVETEEPQQTPDGVERPEIVLPDNLQLVFEGWEADDAEEQAVLNDGSERLRSVFAAAAYDRDPNAEHVRFYNAEGAALENAKYYIEGFTEYDLTIEGTIRYLEPDVTLDGDGRATLNYCADESQASAVYVDSGEPYEESAEQPHLFYSTNLEKNEQGVWVTTNVYTQREDCAS
jgi:hypothetical protein